MEDCSIIAVMPGVVLVISDFRKVEQYRWTNIQTVLRNPRKLADFSMETENEFSYAGIVEENQENSILIDDEAIISIVLKVDDIWKIAPL